MQAILSIFKREIRGYFETPIAYVLIVVFLITSGIFTFYLGNFYRNEQADLVGFFNWHVWLYLFLMPAIAMRLWSEEKRLGTIETILTFPIKTADSVIGKFLAAWFFTFICLALTFPIWITVNYLGDPENGIIFLSYLTSFALAGCFLAVGSCMSSLTDNQVIAFIITVATCFVFTISGLPMILDFFVSLNFPQYLINTISSFSFIQNFEDILKGSVSLKNIVFFISFITLWLYINIIALEVKRG